MTSLVPSSGTKKFLAEASRKYHDALPGSLAQRYLTVRQITSEAQTYFRLGVVADPVPEHERYRDRLAIPYISPTGTVAIRYRSIPSQQSIIEAELLMTNGAVEAALQTLKDGDVDKPKYLSAPGEPSRIFNASALKRPETYVCVCEGELDTVTASMAGLPAIGLPGAQSWDPLMGRCLRWYRRVFVLADADKAGTQFAETLAKTVRNVEIIPMSGGDVNSFVVEHGEQALRERIGV